MEWFFGPSVEKQNALLQEQVFNLLFTAKSLERAAKKCKREESKEKKKIKIAISNNDADTARVHATNAIHSKNQALAHIRLASRLKAVGANLNRAIIFNETTESVKIVVKEMDKSAREMRLDRLSALMMKFEKSFDGLDIRMMETETAMNSTTSSTMPSDEVDALIREVSEANGLEFEDYMNDLTPGSATTSQAEKQQDELSVRLAKLRNQNWDEG